MISWHINKEAFTDDFANTCKKYKPHFNKIKNTLENTIFSEETVSFNFMGNAHCECDTPLGMKTVSESLNDYLLLLNEFQNCAKIKYIAVFKHFYDGSFEEVIKHNKFEIVKIHISEIDSEFLANIKDDIVYKILYYKKWN